MSRRFEWSSRPWRKIWNPQISKEGERHGHCHSGERIIPSTNLQHGTQMFDWNRRLIMNHRSHRVGNGLVGTRPNLRTQHTHHVPFLPPHVQCLDGAYVVPDGARMNVVVEKKLGKGSELSNSWGIHWNFEDDTKLNKKGHTRNVIAVGGRSESLSAAAVGCLFQTLKRGRSIVGIVIRWKSNKVRGN